MFLFFLLGLVATGAVMASSKARAAEVSPPPPPKKPPLPTFLKNDALDHLFMMFRGGEGIGLPKIQLDKGRAIYATVQARYKARKFPAITLPELMVFYKIARSPGPTRDKYRSFTEDKIEHLYQKTDDYFEVLSAIIVGRRLENLPSNIQAGIIPILKKVAARIKARQPAPVRPDDLALFYNVLTGKIKYA